MFKRLPWAPLKGIGLLELMLALAIIAVLLIMATRYYQAASVSQQVSTGVDMFSGAKGAVGNWGVDHPGASPSSLTIESLIEQGYLPNSYNTDPWGGSFTLTPGSGNYVLEMPAVPIAACQSLYDRLNQTLNSGLGEKFTNPQNGLCDTGGPTALKVQYNY